MRNANELLAAAQANHDATLQAVFATAAQDYYAAQAAQGTLAAALDVEATARLSFEAASERVANGVAPITDALQAQTALAQATFNRAKAGGDWQVFLGTLATGMNLRPDTAVRLPDVDGGVRPDSDFVQAVSALMDDARRTHPSVLQAQAQLNAARAKADQIHADGLPKLSIVARSLHNNQPIAPAVGSPQFAASGRDWSVGLQINIPLFEGFGRDYQFQQAQAQVELQAAALEGARSQVALDVWTAYQSLQTATQNLDNSAKLLSIARASQQATQARYVTGVGNIVELLNAQSALATATSQRLQALTGWRSSRLQLAGKLGTLGMWRIGPS